MKQPDGTIPATNGRTSITVRAPVAKLRLAGLTLTALIGALVVIWINQTTWQRVDNLQQQFAGLKPDNFYRGVRMRNDLQRLNDTLLRYRLRGDTNDAAAFRAEAQAFKLWLDQNSTNAMASMEQQFLEEVRTAYADYLTESTEVLQSGLGWLQSTQAKNFKTSYERVQNLSRRLLSLCDSFISNQRSSFTNFLQESNQTLSNFKQLLQVSLTLLLTLAGALVFLAYRGMIAPLRLQLSETHAILMRQEKLASLGVLAAGVAHEIRNPLTAIKFRLYSLKKSAPDALADNEDATVINDEINRLERIVHDFLQFARPSEPELVAVPVQRFFTEVRDLLKLQLKKSDIELTLEPPAEPVWVRADTQQIKQVLINLVQNSAESIGRQGQITLRARDIAASGRKGAASSVILEVSDNGKGIPPEVRKRLFDPFFTTKDGGTGLGLPIAARIVEKHGGELRYHTELGRGTTFGLVLPRVHEHET